MNSLRNSFRNNLVKRFSGLLGFALLMTGAARAQDVQILFPQNGQAVRGEITVRFSGVPDGGYAVVKLDGNFATATSQNTYVLNTFPPTFPGDGTHKVSITAINPGGKAVGTSEVSFEVANNRIDPSAGTTPLTHWEKWMRQDPNVQRYRVFAQSDATIETPDSAGGSGGGGSGGRGGGSGGGGEDEATPAPLDWQVSALMRRIVRDVDMYSDDKREGGSSANIRTVVQTAFQRQRESETADAAGGEGGGGGRGGGSSSKKKSSGPGKAPWNKDWTVAPEEGQYFVKMIEPSGREINATRKAPTIALADLLPTFPTTPVSPGSTWETRMTFIGELSSREPVNVSVPITFTSFETIQTPAGFNRRTAKLESRFQMPENLAKRTAVNLVLQGGEAAGGSGGGGSRGGGGGGAAAAGDAPQTAASLEPEELAEYLEAIKPIRTSVARILWFDVENHRVLRSEDRINTYFEYMEADAAGSGGGGGGSAGRGGGGAGGEAAEAEPTKYTYVMTVTTWFDDAVPPVSDTYSAGFGTAHSRDNVQDPKIDKIRKPVQP